MGISGSDPAINDCRAGVMRAGASRANYYSHVNVVMTVGGVVRNASTDVLKDLTITQALNDEPDTCGFSVLPGAGWTPVAGQELVVGLGSASNREFGGQIVEVSESFGEGLDESLFLTSVRASDYSRLANRRAVTAYYAFKSATFIVLDLMARFTSGFTAYSVAPDLPTIDEFSVIDAPLTSVLLDLATRIKGGYYFDAYRDLHFFGPAGDLGPRAGTNPRTLTFGLESLVRFEHAKDLTQLCNRVIAEGKHTQCPVGTPDGQTSVTVEASADVDYLVVAGGGGGGSLRGGGGGAGGVLAGTDTIAAGSYAVVVGGGGTGGGSPTNGGDSTYNGHTAVGGGHGVTPTASGASGGSGGGGAGSASGGLGTPGQGNNGGAGVENIGENGGGGGGGAGAPGGSAGLSGGHPVGGPGGAGVASSVSGSLQYYGGGGGGNADSGSGGGGLGGGGNGGAGGSPGTAGGANTGGGGGGGNNYGGGSGVVILSYPVGALSATGGTITTVGGRTIHTFTSNGTFTVSSVTITAPIPSVTDLPVEDANQLDANGGTVRMATHILPYLSFGGAILNSGENPPGSALTADATVTAGVGPSSISVADSTVFTESTGWVKAGEQIVRYSSKSSGVLSGIPTIGFGAFVATVKSGASVTWLPRIVLSNTGVVFDPALAANTDVVQRVTVDDTAAQAAAAAIEGGDGVHERQVSDDRLSTGGLRDLATGILLGYSSADGIATSRIETEDMNARPGRQLSVNIGGIVKTLLITRAEITFPIPNGLPRRICEASSLRQAGLIDVVVTG